VAAEAKFSFRAWSNILPTKPPEALIEGILLRGRLGVIFAQPDNGKTFTAIGASGRDRDNELDGPLCSLIRPCLCVWQVSQMGHLIYERD